MDESEIFVFSRAGDSGAKYGENGGRDDPAGELALTLGVNESTATRGGGEITAVVAKQRPKVSMMMASW